MSSKPSGPMDQFVRRTANAAEATRVTYGSAQGESLIDGAGQLTYWNVALRLVVLVQPSSASAERVFTQLKLILETCGDSMLAQTLRVRLSHRCNGHDLRKIYVGVD